MEPRTGHVVIAWTPLVILFVLWIITLVYMRRSPASVRQTLETLARTFLNGDGK